jgi:hypothetical protein
MFRFITQTPLGILLFVLAVFLLGAAIDNGLEYLMVSQ